MGKSQSDRIYDASERGKRGYGSPNWDNSASASENYLAQDEYERSKKQKQDQEAQIRDLYSRMYSRPSDEIKTSPWPTISGGNSQNDIKKPFPVLGFMFFFLLISSVEFVCFLGNSRYRPADESVYVRMSIWCVFFFLNFTVLIWKAVKSVRRR